jgi:hypothetical protein
VSCNSGTGICADGECIVSTTTTGTTETSTTGTTETSTTGTTFYGTGFSPASARMQFEVNRDLAAFASAANNVSGQMRAFSFRKA